MLIVTPTTAQQPTTGTVTSGSTEQTTVTELTPQPTTLAATTTTPCVKKNLMVDSPKIETSYLDTPNNVLSSSEIEGLRTSDDSDLKIENSNFTLVLTNVPYELIGLNVKGTNIDKVSISVALPGEEDVVPAMEGVSNLSHIFSPHFGKISLMFYTFSLIFYFFINLCAFEFKKT